MCESVIFFSVTKFSQLSAFKCTVEVQLEMSTYCWPEVFNAVVLDLVGGNEPHQFHTGIHRTLL